MWHILLYCIGAFYAILILPLLAYGLYHGVRMVLNAFMHEEISHTEISLKEQTLQESMTQPPPSSSNVDSKVHTATPKRVHVASLRDVPVSSNFTDTPTPDRMIRVHPSQSDRFLGIEQMHVPSPTHSPVSSSKKPIITRMGSNDSDTECERDGEVRHSTLLRLPSKEAMTLRVAAHSDSEDSGILSDDSDDNEIRELEAYFISDQKPMSRLLDARFERSDFPRIVSAELHSRNGAVAVLVQPSAPPTPDVRDRMPFEQAFALSPVSKQRAKTGDSPITQKTKPLPPFMTASSGGRYV